MPIWNEFPMFQAVSWPSSSEIYNGRENIIILLFSNTKMETSLLNAITHEMQSD